MGPLFFAFVLLPIMELFLLIRIGRMFGAANTLLFVFAMGLLGILVAKTQGRKVLRAWQASLAAGRVPEQGVLDGVMILVGALLLITPGVISDVIGLFCLLPITRRAIGAALQRYLDGKITRGQVDVQGFGFGFPPRPSGVPPRARPVTTIPEIGPRRTHARPRPRPRPRHDDIIDTEGEEV